MRCAVFVRSEKSGRPQRTSVSSTQDVIKPASASVASFQAQGMPRLSRSLSVQGIGSTSITKTQKALCPSEGTCNRPSGGGGRHIQPPTGSNAAKLKHKCPFEGCPWRFATPYKLRRHIKSHTKETPYQCKECGRGFSVRYNLLMHIQTIHSVPQKYRCPLKGCKEAFHTQSRLNGHLRRIHKKDWKQLQQTQHTAPSSTDVDSATNQTFSSEPPKPRSHSTSSLPPPSTSSTTSSFTCSECGRGFTSQPKLSAHMRTHSGDRPYKCNIQSCQKSFCSAEKLSKHMETHKGTKQFSCPYENCNRIFLRQSHLKNHLKIHTRDQFICPVADCRAKFATENEYNGHLNTHMSYQHQCPHPGCQLTFPTQKRLDLHCRVSHLGNQDAGIKVSSAAAPTLALSPTSTIPANLSPAANQLDCPGEPHQHDILYSVGGTRELLENLELPDLRVEDIEAVISEHTDWSGEQIESFFRSLELNEVECTRSMSGYESDSGYSTYDVSPLASGMSYTGSLSPAITPVTPNPIFPPPTSSPTAAAPLHPFQEEFLAASLSATISPPPPLSSTSSSDGNFFGAFEFPPLPGTPADSPSEHSLTPSALYSSDYYMAHSHFHFPPSVSSSQAQPHSFPMPYHLPMPMDGVRSAPPATTANLASSIEDGKHTVILVPNSYAGNGAVMPSTVASSPVEAPIQIKLEPGFACSGQPFNGPSQFPMLDQFPMVAAHACTPVSAEEQTIPTNPAAAGMSAHAQPQGNAAATPTDGNNCLSSLCLPGIKQKIEAIMQPKRESSSSFKKSACKDDKPSKNAGSSKAAAGESAGEANGSSDGPKETRPVYARILSKSGNAQAATGNPSPPSQTQASVTAAKPQVKSGRSGSCSSKLRQHRSGSVPMKAGQRKKSQWPKSMNPGNLVAFRNFILNKLKKGQEPEALASSLSSTQPLMHHPMVQMPSSSGGCCESPHELSFVPSKTNSLGGLRGEYGDLLAEMSFNPDSLLSSESSGDSPLAVFGGGSSPLGDFGLGLADEIGLGSPSLQNLSAPSASPSHHAEATMDFDGCVQFFTEDPITQSLSESNLPSSFDQDLDNIFKTDRDPLLGALS